MSYHWLPNAITLVRCLLVPAIIGSMIIYGGTLIPFVLFCAAAVSDFLDGWLARALKAQSEFGAVLDPIADKLLVAGTLMTFCYLQEFVWWLVVPTALIVLRDLGITLLRIRAGYSLPVSTLAKIKTALEMLAIGLFLLPFVPILSHVGLGVLWVAGLLSVWTGWCYLKTVNLEDKTAAL
ncbi:MAG: CDP-diacylglycerol--glycerol-3-phosphate 3-phosphatidyltransferase [Pseudomonadota bacterium]